MTGVQTCALPISIATSDDQEVQRALTEAYESKSLRGKQLLKARRLIEVPHYESTA